MNEILKVGDIRPLVKEMPGFNQWSEWFDDQAETPLHAALMEACWNGLRWGCEALGLLPAWGQFEAVERTAREQYEAVERPAREQYEAVERPALEQYEAVERPAREQYEAVKHAAWEQYEAVERPALEQYEAVERPALENLIDAVVAACTAMLANRS